MHYPVLLFKDINRRGKGKERIEKKWIEKKWNINNSFVSRVREGYVYVKWPGGLENAFFYKILSSLVGYFWPRSGQEKAE